MWYLLVFMTFVLGMALLRDKLLYNLQGSAQVDDPDQEEYSIVKGPADAIAQRQIDRCSSSESSPEEKKK